MVGANDPRTSRSSRHPLWHPAWNAAYSERVQSFMTLASSTGAKVVCRHAPDAIPGLSAAMANLDSIYQADAAKNPAVTTQQLDILGTHRASSPVHHRERPGGQHPRTRRTHISRRSEVLSQAVMGTLRSQLHINFLPDMARGLASRSARRKSTRSPAGRPSPRVHERWGWSHDASTRRSTSRT